MIDNFCEFEVKESAIRVKGEENFEVLGCVGTFEESFGVKTITKKCEGKVKEKRTVPDGSGELKLSLHMKWKAYIDTFNLLRTELKEGVYAYGSKQHQTFAYVCKALDMDGNIKYKAYPNCTVATGIARKVENGGEEVAEIELTISLAADEYNECMYEASEEELSDETVKEEWMTAWKRELIEAA